MKIKVTNYSVELPGLPDWVDYTAPKDVEVEVRRIDDLPDAITELVEVDYNDWAEVIVDDIEYEFDIKELLIHAEVVEFNRDIDEKYAGGLWDLAGDITYNEKDQEEIYNKMWEQVEAFQKEVL